MADVLEEYVTQVIDKKMQNSDYLIAIPSKVTQVLSNGMYVVQLISNGSEYCVPNWSGAVLEVGDNVQLYYKGKILSDRTAYIGAAAYMVNRQWGLVEGNFIVDDGSISSAYPKGRRSIPTSINDGVSISRYGFRSFQDQTVLASFNGIIRAANSDCATKIEFYIDNQEYDYKYIMDMPNSQHYYCPTVTLPLKVEAGTHIFEVKIFGDNQHAHIGYYEDARSFVIGQGLTEVEVENG